MVLQQAEGRGVIVINRKKYTDKCFNLFHKDGLIHSTMIQLKQLKGYFKGL